MASYEWLKATLFQAKEKKDRTEEEQEFINQHLTKDKYKNRTPQQAERDFIDSCQWSWNTEDCLKLMKEGLVPYDIVNSIIQETWGITNKFFSIFNSKTSLQSLIGSKHIAILRYGQDILALDPSDKQEKNNERIEQFFKKIKEAKDIIIYITGTGEYAKGFSLFQDYWWFLGDVVFYPSNIPNWGAIATINGSKKRINEHKDNMRKIIDENRKKKPQKTGNGRVINSSIVISSTSYGNAMGVECSKILADEIFVKHQLMLRDIARDFFIFQSGEDLFNGIKKIKNKRYIERIDVTSTGNNSLHPRRLSNSLSDRIDGKIKLGIKAEDKIDDKNKEDSKDKEEEKNKDINVINVINCNEAIDKDRVNKIDKKDDEEEEKKLNNLPVNKIEEYGRKECDNVGEINNNTLTINNEKNKVKY